MEKWSHQNYLNKVFYVYLEIMIIFHTFVFDKKFHEGIEISSELLNCHQFVEVVIRDNDILGITSHIKHLK